MSNDRLTDYFNPFIGCLGGGDCLPGPYLPHSLAKPGPDTVPPHRSKGYGHHDSSCKEPLRISRFSQNHVAGTGGGGRYGNVGLTPFTGRLRLRHGGSEIAEEVATAGYYSVLMMPEKIKAEVTCTPRVGVYRFSYPEGTAACLLIDAGAVIQIDRKDYAGNELGRSIGGFIEVVDSTEVIGRGDMEGGWGHEFPYSVFFCIRFDKPIEDRRFGLGSTMFGGETVVTGAEAKAVVSFGQLEEINVRVGISFVSIANARASLDREVSGKSFDEIRTEAEDIWEEALSAVSIKGGTQDDRIRFYTSLARFYCMPTDLGIDDENWLWKSEVRNFTDFYCLWDSVRNANSFMALINPALHRDILNCLLDIADHVGWVPDAWIAGHSAHVQGGSSADTLFWEAYLKNIEGVDYRKALSYMRKNTEVESSNPYLHGRYLRGYRDLGFVPPEEVINCVSRHLEYGFQDWCTGMLAHALGDPELASTSFQNSQKTWNLWRDDIKTFAPKKEDGSWVNPFCPENPTRWDYWYDPYFYEGTAHEWSLTVLHDMPELIARHGGAEAFETHLDRFFEGLIYGWKEIILHTPYLYHYVGRPDKSSLQARKELSTRYHTGRDGLPDNEDMGSQSTFIMCVSLGLYPVMGQDLYLLSAPLFEESEIKLGDSGNKLVIKADSVGAEFSCIVGAKLNGKPLDRAWLKHSEIADGGVIELALAEKPSDWGTMLPPATQQNAAT